MRPRHGSRPLLFFTVLLSLTACLAGCGDDPPPGANGEHVTPTPAHDTDPVPPQPEPGSPLPDPYRPMGKWCVLKNLYWAPIPPDRRDEVKEEDYGWSLDGEPVFIDAGSRQGAAHLGLVKGPVALHVVGESFTDPDVGPAVRAVAGAHAVSMKLTGATDADMERVRDLPGLEVLDLSGVSARGIAALSDLPSVRMVRVDGIELDAAAIQAFARMPRLEILMIVARYDIGDELIAEIAKIRTLRVLHVDYCSMTIEGYNALRGHENLEVLNLDMADVPVGALAVLRSLPRLRKVNLHQVNAITTEMLAELSPHPTLEVLDLRSNRVDALPDLKGWPELRKLDVSANPVTLEGLATLPAARHLESLAVPFSKVEGGLVPLLPPTLRELDLTHRPLGDDELAQLPERCPSLTHLDLNGTGAGPRTLAAIAALKGLEVLDLEGTAIGDAEVRHLAGLTALRDLTLRDTDVTDRSLPILQALPNLEDLDVCETLMTRPEGFRPTVDVDWYARRD